MERAGRGRVVQKPTNHHLQEVKVTNSDGSRREGRSVLFLSQTHDPI